MIIIAFFMIFNSRHTTDLTYIQTHIDKFDKAIRTITSSAKRLLQIIK